MSYTPAQQSIIDVDLHDDDVVVVSARAGTGKTHTLTALARTITSSYVYIAFNVAIAEACPVQPASTLDALVLDAYQKKHGKVEIVDALTIDHPKAAVVRQTIHNWCCSAAARIDDEHVPTSDKHLKDVASVVVNDATRAKTFTHNLLQVYAPPIPYHVVLVDEAQDLNPRQATYLLRHTGPRVFIGDPHQSIYRFRGSSGNLSFLLEHATKTFVLNQSFRFGPEIARVANAILALKDVEPDVEGVGDVSRVLMDDVDVVPDAIIARTHAGLFRAIVQLQKRCPGTLYNVVGPAREQCERWLRLASEDPSMHSAQDKRVLKSLNYKLLSQMKSSFSEKGIQFTTVHQSKGLEFDCVALANDFRGVVRRVPTRGERKTFTASTFSRTEELNLNYVAVTRARRTLIINTSIKSLIDPEK